MEKNIIMQEIDVFGLFQDLKTKGSTKLSDHVIKTHYSGGNGRK